MRKLSQRAEAQRDYAVDAVLPWLSGAKIIEVGNAIVLTEQIDDGLTVIVTEKALEIQLPMTRWMGVHLPLRSGRPWCSVSLPIHLLECRDILDEVRAARRAQYEPCTYCERMFSPEHRDNGVCHGCAERYLGVVH